MLIDIILLFLLAGLPYYIYFEKSKTLKDEKIFLLSSGLVFVSILLSFFFEYRLPVFYEIIAFLASLYSLYKANKTNNLFKLSYYVLFFNAPLLIIFHTKESLFYGISLLVALFGIYLMAKYYERNYGSANYQSITGITLVTPFAGLFLTIYLTSIALYPPFPNALFFLNGILNSHTNTLWYFAVIIIFFGNFLIAMRVMAKTVFGKPNEYVHYIDVNKKERWIHGTITMVLLLLSILGLKELLS